MGTSTEYVIRWHRKGFKRHWWWLSTAGKMRGRPCIDQELHALVLRMAEQNPTWRAPRIHGELPKLGIKVSERTVSRYLPKRNPNVNRGQTWLPFVKNHRHAIGTMDFFTMPTVTFRVFVDSEESLCREKMVASQASLSAINAALCELGWQPGMAPVLASSAAVLPYGGAFFVLLIRWLHR